MLSPLACTLGVEYVNLKAPIGPLHIFIRTHQVKSRRSCGRAYLLHHAVFVVFTMTWMSVDVTGPKGQVPLDHEGDEKLLDGAKSKENSF